MLVTIIADASWCPESRAGGWAAWIVSARGRIVHSATFKKKMRSANEAELCAVSNGLQVSISTKLAQNGDTIIIQSDCMRVVELLIKRLLPISRMEREAMEFIRKLQVDNQLIFIPKHVKGHTSGKTKRTWVNNFVDRLARKKMNAGRK